MNPALVFLAGLGLGAISGASLVVVVVGALTPDDAGDEDRCERGRKAGAL